MLEINRARASFEGWASVRGKSDQLSWTGSRYAHPRIQSQWIAFLMGWTMCMNQKG
jgi:hypothetical protein